MPLPAAARHKGLAECVAFALSPGKLPCMEVEIGRSTYCDLACFVSKGISIRTIVGLQMLRQR